MHRPMGDVSFANAWLPPQVGRNALIAPRRAPVEQVFGTLKRSYGYRTVRYLGLARNLVELWFKFLAYNLRRAARLQAMADG